jgi:hypothetical protein
MVTILDAPREFILSHKFLSLQEERGESAADNIPNFRNDFLNGKLKDYEGTFVSYQKGILCGQSENRKQLFNKATEYYGFSSLAVFNVPMFETNLEDAIKNALGKF